MGPFVDTSLLNTANTKEENLLEKVAVSQLDNNPPPLYLTIPESLFSPLREFPTN
jgi:hypothetical protein